MAAFRGGIGERGEVRAFGHRAKARCYRGREVKSEGLRVKGALVGVVGGIRSSVGLRS